MMIASAMANAKTVDVLLDNGADPNLADANGYTSLHRVVRDSDYGINLGAKDAILAIVESLLKHGANPNARLIQDKEKAAVLRFIATNYTNPDLDLDGVVAGTGANRNKVNEVLKAELGMTFTAYLKKLRLTESARLLTETPAVTVADLAGEAMTPLGEAL